MTVLRLPARVKKLEARIIPPGDGKPTFAERLVAFRIVYFAVYDHDRGMPDCLPDESAFEHVMKAHNATEAEVRRFVHDGLEEFGPHVQLDPDWSPLNGFDEAALERHRQHQAYLDRLIATCS